jgi:hypothetical protein
LEWIGRNIDRATEFCHDFSLDSHLAPCHLQDSD